MKTIFGFICIALAAAFSYFALDSTIFSSSEKVPEQISHNLNQNMFGTWKLPDKPVRLTETGPPATAKRRIRTFNPDGSYVATLLIENKSQAKAENYSVRVEHMGSWTGDGSSLSIHINSVRAKAQNQSSLSRSLENHINNMLADEVIEERLSATTTQGFIYSNIKTREKVIYKR